MADFNIVIKVQSGPAVRGAKAVEGQLRRTESQANRLGASIKRAFAGLVAGQAIAKGIRFLANFGQEMSTVKAIVSSTGKLTEDQFQKMKMAAIDLGTTTRFTSTQAASGMLFLARSGYNAQQIMEAIPNVLNLAQAGALDLGRAADITTNILKGFNLATSETGRVADVLALSANSANTTVEQMGQAMKFVAPLARGTNMTLEQTVAAIQAMSNAGIQASMAGTGLRRVIGALEGPTAAERKIITGLGLKMKDLKVSSNGTIPALEKLKGKTNDIGILLRLFGQRGGSAAGVMSNLSKEALDFAKANGLASGTAKEVARMMDDNLNGALLHVKSAFQGLLILWGDVSTVTVLRRLLEHLAKALRFLAVRAEAVDKAFRVLIAGIVLFVITTGKAKLALQGLTKAMAGNPMGLILIAITAIIAALVLFKDEISLSGQGFITLGDIGSAAMDQIRGALDGLLYFITSAVPSIGTSWSDVFGAIVTGALSMLQAIAQVFDKIYGFIKGLVGALGVGFQLIFQAANEAWANIANGLIKIVGKALNWLINKYDSLAERFHLPLVATVNVNDHKFKKLPAEALLTASDMGAAFKKGLQNSGLEDVFLNMLDDAEKKAYDRIKLPEKKTKTKPLGNPSPDEIYGKISDVSGTAPPSFGKLLNDIRKETTLLTLNSRAMEIQQGLLDMEDKMKRKLSGTERLLAFAALTRLQQQREMAQAYDEIRGPAEDFAAKEQALIALEREHKISIEELGIALQKLKIAQLDLNTDMNSGLSRGLLKIKKQITDVASTAENTLTNAFNSAQDALVSFVTTGKANFSGLVDSILADLTKLLLQKALLSFIGGPAAGAGGGGFKFATGGQFTVGGAGGIDSQPVAFQATPGERVSVETPAQQKANDKAKSGGMGNVTIINVSSREEALAAVASNEGSKVIINMIGQNKRAIRRQLG